MCSVCETNRGPRVRLIPWRLPSGAVAQLVEHLHGMQGVRGSNSPQLHRSSRESPSVVAIDRVHPRRVRRRRGQLRRRPAGRAASPTAPLGCDSASRSRWPRGIARCSTALQTFLGVGSIHDQPRGRGIGSRACTFTVNSHRGPSRGDDPVRRDASCCPCAKRVQFDGWRAALDEYEASSIRPDGARDPRRARCPDATSPSGPRALSQPLLPCHRLLNPSRPSSAASSRPKELRPY